MKSSLRISIIIIILATSLSYSSPLLKYGISSAFFVTRDSKPGYSGFVNLQLHPSSKFTVSANTGILTREMSSPDLTTDYYQSYIPLGIGVHYNLLDRDKIFFIFTDIAYHVAPKPKYSDSDGSYEIKDAGGVTRIGFKNNYRSLGLGFGLAVPIFLKRQVEFKVSINNSNTFGDFYKFLVGFYF